MYTAGIITASDKGSRGERIDKSGPLIMALLEEKGIKAIGYILVEDDKAKIKEAIMRMTDELGVSLIFTTGGTGFSMRDVTPEATREVIHREAPGIAEAIRLYSLRITDRAMLSRGIAGIRNKTLIINLPGSPKAVKEAIEYIIEPVKHGMDILLGNTGECARNDDR